MLVESNQRVSQTDQIIVDGKVIHSDWRGYTSEEFNYENSVVGDVRLYSSVLIEVTAQNNACIALAETMSN